MQLAERLLATMEAEEDLPPAPRLAFERNQAAREGWKRMSPPRRRNHYGWDTEGRMTTLNYPGNTNDLTYTYDSMGNQNGFTDSITGLSATATYGTAGEMDSLGTHPSETNGYPIPAISETFQYNNLWQLTQVTGSFWNGNSLSGVSLQYVYPAGQNNGRVSQVVGGGLNQTITYQYDSLNRLSTAAATNGAWGQSYKYDGFGNLLAKTITAGSGMQFSASYNPATNQSSSYFYDANGNTLNGPFGQYVYDMENRIVNAYNSAAGYTYGYDPQNKRVMVQTGEGSFPTATYVSTFTFYGIDGRPLTTFAINSPGSCPVQNGNYCTTGPNQGYLYLAGKLLGQPDGTPMLADRLESQQYGGVAYYPWGEPMGSPAPTGDVEFATYVRDAVGQDYADQRYYNSNAGRFYTPDPAWRRAINPRNPITWNRYVYANDDPANRNDPSGLTDVVIAGITNAPGDGSIDAFATQIGAIEAFPYAGGSTFGGILAVAGLTLQQAAQAYTVADAIEAAAADSNGPINIFAFSGGAAAFVNALPLLPASIVSRIGNVAYASPGYAGALPTVNGDPPTVVYGNGPIDSAVTAFFTAPPGTNFVQTNCVGHNASCEFSAVAYLAGTPCNQCSAFSAPNLGAIQQALAAAQALAYAAVWGPGPQSTFNFLDYFSLIFPSIEQVSSTINYNVP
ncbi:MAG TPA: RHS repeat-associated core domain-containing protein [Bryobacteraceae bacterium]|nr:RHS repeat-associated core domain-containing protein [Bryobacteraceae bacterium]